MQKQFPSIKGDQEIKKNEWKHLHTVVRNPWTDQQCDSTWMSQSSLFLLCPVFHSSYIWSLWLTSVSKHDCLNRNLHKQRGKDWTFFFTHQGTGCYRGQNLHAGWIQSLLGRRMKPSRLLALEMPVTSAQIFVRYR